MSRKTIFANNHFYHVFNRGTRKTTIFHDKTDYRRWEEVLYWCTKYNYRYSLFKYQLQQYKRSGNDPTKLIENLEQSYKLTTPPVEIISYAHMPNHFHLVLKQIIENGISIYMQRIATSYSKYFNTRYDLSGTLYERRYQAVRITSDAQFLQVNRYIHINPLASRLTTKEKLSSYPWTSFPSYLTGNKHKFLTKKYLMNNFNSSISKLRQFTLAPFEENSVSLLKKTTLDDDFDWYKEEEEDKKQRQRELIFKL